MSDPFQINGPVLWSFSGGRTSAMMVWKAIQAHGGRLPENNVVAFANTGKERPETLRFVYECSKRLGVNVVWVEWRPKPDQAEKILQRAEKSGASMPVALWCVENASDKGFEVVGYNSASRAGEPFDALIDHKQRLPNGRERWCTQFLKVMTLHDLMRDLGYGEPGDYFEPIGLRADEMDRVADGWAASEKDGRKRAYPLMKAGITKRDVHVFWWGEGKRYETSIRPQGFDLELPDLWGNCDLCFAMGVRRREERVRQDASVAQWWGEGEGRTGGRFSKTESVLDLVARAKAHKATPDLLAELEEEIDGDCGTWCPGSSL